MYGSNRSIDHEYFKELGALVLSGQVSAREYVELRSHLKECTECREEMGQSAGIVYEQIPLLAPEADDERIEPAVSISRDDSYEKRFWEGMALKGFPSVDSDTRERVVASATAARRSRSNALYAWAVAAILLVATANLSYKRFHLTTLDKSKDAEIQRLAATNTALQQRITLSQSQDTQEATNAQAQKVELTSQQEKYSQLEAQYKTLDTELQSVNSERQTLEARAESDKLARDDVSKTLQQDQASIEQLTAQLQDLRSHHSDDVAERELARARAEKLEKDVSTMRDQLGQAERLLAADRDIRDLMGARNLHLTDIYDVDGKGKTERPFGRVFYTDKKSLTFYAFDLGTSPKTAAANHSFQAWGYQESAQNSAVSLGIFYQDDQTQNRWVLKFNDAAVLSGIDAVFITVEPRGGSAKPTGQKLLWAFLNSTPNHP
jgi:Anti-sigma-K factor rskA